MGKIISIVDKEKRYCSEKILDIVNILDDYDVEFRIDREEILLILSDLYDLYLKKRLHTNILKICSFILMKYVRKFLKKRKFLI